MERKSSNGNISTVLEEFNSSDHLLEETIVDSVCCICFSETDAKGTALIQCRRCSIYVHIQCYGKTIPIHEIDTNWYCDACQYIQEQKKNENFEPYCAICPINGGALRETSIPGVFAHVLCCHWIPELSNSLDPDLLDQDIHLSYMHENRDKIKCFICSNKGGCVQCVSGRCARGFHVICGLRAPSDLVYTGYSRENHQVYHCKMHIKDAIGHPFALVDNSWRNYPHVKEYLQSHPSINGKCRICDARAPQGTMIMHETQCLLNWLVKYDKSKRALTSQNAPDLKSILKQEKQNASNHNMDANRKSNISKRGKRVGPSESGAVSRGKVANQPCRECGELIPLTRMMGHLKKFCPDSKDAISYRQENGTASTVQGQTSKSAGRKRRKSTSNDQLMDGYAVGDSSDITVKNGVDVEMEDLSDVLFATWPGQTQGNLMQSGHFWKVIRTQYFDKRNGKNRRFEQMCKMLCGAKYEEITNSVRNNMRLNKLLTLKCEEKILMERNVKPIIAEQKKVVQLNDNDDQQNIQSINEDLDRNELLDNLNSVKKGANVNILNVKTMIHSCDDVMRRSRIRCPDDVESRMYLELGHISQTLEKLEDICPTNSENQVDGDNDQQINVATTKEIQNMNFLLVSELKVVFRNINALEENKTMDNSQGEPPIMVKYLLQLVRNQEEIQEIDGSYSDMHWSKFHHDAVAKLVGPSDENNRLPIYESDTQMELWTSIKLCNEVGHSSTPSCYSISEALDNIAYDELTPEINLLFERLREQWQVNRNRIRPISRKLIDHEIINAASNNEKEYSELYYKEYVQWKQLCRSLVQGYNSVQQLVERQLKESTITQESDKGTQDEDIDDGTCVICFDGSSPESNPIIFCDRCDVAVHQKCYGVLKVPSAEFYCDRCRWIGKDFGETDSFEDAMDLSSVNKDQKKRSNITRNGEKPGFRMSRVFCQLCSLTDGAMKKTIDGQWVHVVCAIWCPQVWIGNLQNLSEISIQSSTNPPARFVDSISEIANHAKIAVNVLADKKALKLGSSMIPAGEKPQGRGDILFHNELHTGSICMACRVACGRTIQCCAEKCTTSYHPLCAWYEGLPMIISLDPEQKYIYGGGGRGLNFKMYCANHFPSPYNITEQQFQRMRRYRYRVDRDFISKMGSQQLSGLPNSEFSMIKQGENMISSNFFCENPELVQSCAACFRNVSPVHLTRLSKMENYANENDAEAKSHTSQFIVNSEALNKRQVLLRCQTCSTFIHVDCIIRNDVDITSPHELFKKQQWVCEKCIVLSYKGHKAAPCCIVCKHNTGYMMPCINPSKQPNTVAMAAAIKSKLPLPLSSETREGNSQSGQLNTRVGNMEVNNNSLLATSEQIADQTFSLTISERLNKAGNSSSAQPADKLSKKPAAAKVDSPYNLDQSGRVSQKQKLGPFANQSFDSWIHVFCSKWSKAKFNRRNKLLCAYHPQSISLDKTRCELCQKIGQNIVKCTSCTKRFHPFCAAKARLYYSMSAKTDWKFYCRNHIPKNVSWDYKRQAWLALEDLQHLQSLRAGLERGRMLIEMARKRDRRHKRLLNNCFLPRHELAIDAVLKKNPSAAMRDLYEQITGEILKEIRDKKAQERTRNKVDKKKLNTSTTRSQPTNLTSSKEDRINGMERIDTYFLPTSTRSKRKAAARANENMKRPRLSYQNKDISISNDDNQLAQHGTKKSSHEGAHRSPGNRRSTRVAVNKGQGINHSNAESKALPLNIVFAHLVEESSTIHGSIATRDFDEVIPQQYPELCPAIQQLE